MHIKLVGKSLKYANIIKNAYGTLAEAEAATDRDFAQELRCKATDQLAQLPPHDDVSLHISERAMIGAAWIRAEEFSRGLPYLDFNWVNASAEVAGLAGSALMRVGAMDLALHSMRHAVQSPTVSLSIRLNFGRLLLARGQIQAALNELEEAYKGLGNDHSLATLSLAEALLADGRIDEALNLVPENFQDEKRLIARARLLGAASMHDEASKLLVRARKMMPDSLDLLLLSTELAEVRGRRIEAVFMLRKAIEKDSDNIQLLARLARMSLKGKLSTLAKQAADKAMALAANELPQLQAVALNAHAHVLVEEGKIIEAEKIYRDALKLQPNMVSVMIGLGNLMMLNGNVNEAMELFQKVRAIEPLLGWSQLIHAREVPEDLKVLEEMERAARHPGLEGPACANLLFTLAAAWDKKKDYNHAMTLAREANEVSKKLLTYDPASYRRSIDREIARFSRAFMDSRKGWGNLSRLPVFVLGMPRSGTTLTEQILGSHSKIFAAGELGLVPEQINILESWERRLGSGLHYPECVADLGLDRSRRMAANWLDKLRQFDPCAEYVVDKLPHNFKHIGLIKLLFPNAVIFHCKRDIRDIAISNYITDYAAKFGGMGFAYDLGWIGEQLVDHDRIIEHWHNVFPGQIMDVVYEDLVEDSETWARKMIDFLGLEWEPGVLNHQDLDRPVKTASVWQVRQPVYTTSKARWKRYEAHLGPLEDALKIIPSMPNEMPLPDAEPGLFTLAMKYMQDQRWSEAEMSFIKVLSSYPEHAAAQHFLGGAYFQMGNHEKAVAAMRKSVKLLPIHPTWFENLSKAEHAAGNSVEAQKAWGYAQQLRKKVADASRLVQLPT